MVILDRMVLRITLVVRKEHLRNLSWEDSHGGVVGRRQTFDIRCATVFGGDQQPVFKREGIVIAANVIGMAGDKTHPEVGTHQAGTLRLRH